MEVSLVAAVSLISDMLKILKARILHFNANGGETPNPVESFRYIFVSP